MLHFKLPLGRCRGTGGHRNHTVVCRATMAHLEQDKLLSLNEGKYRACAMTRIFLTIKVVLPQLYCHGVSQENKRFGDDFLSPMPLPQNANFMLVISPPLTVVATRARTMVLQDNLAQECIAFFCCIPDMWRRTASLVLRPGKPHFVHSLHPRIPLNQQCAT